MFVLGLGSNVGSREAFLRAAELLLSSTGRLEVVARSSLYVTPPLGPPQPDYLNAALRVEEGALEPLDVLALTQEVERALGRVRDLRWGPRVIDVDLLHWSGGAFVAPELTLPHAGLLERAFAMAPLLDVAPELSTAYGCARPPRREWWRPERPPEEALDALAFETQRALGAPARVSKVQALEGQLPSAGPAFVALERWDDEGRVGVALT